VAPRIDAHIGLDSKSKLVHSVVASAASVADKHMLPTCCMAEERKVWGDTGDQEQSQSV